MSVLHRQRLAARLRQNWSTMMYPDERPAATQSSVFHETMVDDSLTSLAWLQNLNVTRTSSASASAAARGSGLPLQATSPTAEAEPRGVGGDGDEAVPIFRHVLSADSGAFERLRVDPNEILDPSVSGGSTGMFGWCLHSFADSAQGAASAIYDAASAACQLETDQRRYDASFKPPYSYAALICMAMRETPDQRVTLAQIYDWITVNFAYYRHADQNWQHSIRHHLSLNRFFQKIPRGKDEPGNGGYWTINPDHSNIVDSRRRLMLSGDSFGVGETKESNILETSYAVNNLNAQSLSIPASRKGIATSDPTSDPILDFKTDSLTDVLDLHWALDQDKEIRGRSVKTEGIGLSLIDMQVPPAPVLSATKSLEIHPASHLVSESEFNSLLNFSVRHPTSYHHCLDSIEPPMEDSLGLIIHGVGLTPPDWWWGESLGGHFPLEDGSADFLSPTAQDGDRRRHTPSLSRYDYELHPWAENRSEGIN